MSWNGLALVDYAWGALPSLPPMSSLDTLPNIIIMGIGLIIPEYIMLFIWSFLPLYC
jgi:hypothetical protein